MESAARLHHEKPATEDRLLRASDVQRELGISRATAYRMMTDGTLPVYRFAGKNSQGAMIRVSYRDLQAWRDAHRFGSSHAARPTARTA